MYDNAICDNTCVRILEQIYLKPGIHKREISKQLKIGMPSVDYALNKIGNLLKKEKSGNQIKFYLDYSKDSITPALSVVEYRRFGKLPPSIKIAIGEFLQELTEKPIIVIIFGSYAHGTYTKNSDVDIFLVFQKLVASRSIETTVNKINMRTGAKINPVYLDYKTFRMSIHDATKLFFKNLKRDKIILLGIEWWRRLINEET